MGVSPKYWEYHHWEIHLMGFRNTMGISPLEISMLDIHAQTSDISGPRSDLQMIPTPHAFRISCADSLEILR